MQAMAATPAQAVARSKRRNDPSEGMTRPPARAGGLFFCAVGKARVGSQSPVTLDEVINMPGVKHGLDALLFLKDGKVHFLEVVTFGSEPWDGTFEGFTIGEDRKNFSHG